MPPSSLTDARVHSISRSRDSENLDDADAYVEFVEKSYNDNKKNPIGSYFGIEWLKYADYNKVDSLLAEAPVNLKESSKAKYYQNFAKLRAATAPWIVKEKPSMA